MPRTREDSIARLTFLKEEYRRDHKKLTEEEEDLADAIKSLAIIVLCGVAFFAIIALSCL
ncbi:hypothetical protein [Sphingobacterium kyonggiense]